MYVCKRVCADKAAAVGDGLFLLLEPAGDFAVLRSVVDCFAVLLDPRLLTTRMPLLLLLLLLLRRGVVR